MTGRVIDDSQPAGRLGELGVAGRFEPAQVDREHQHQPERDQEARDGEAEHGQHLHHPVGPAAARVAASTPSTTETTAVTTVAPMTSDSVTANRLVIASVTGWPVNQETPRSPWSALDTQSPNWVSSGWSSPSSCFFSATVSSVADWPRMLRAMSPRAE